jgi:hypothetical protein
MKFLQGVVLGLLACLLFASLVLLPPAFALRNTWLSAGFASREVARLDSAQATRELLPAKLPGDLEPYSSAIDATILELKPWIDAQSQLIVAAIYDYLSGAAPVFAVTLSTTIVQQTLVRNFDLAFRRSPPPGYSQLTAAQQQQRLTRDEQQVAGFIPDTIALNEKTLGTDIFQILSQMKVAYGFAQKTFISLIAASAVLVLLIVVAVRRPRTITRTLAVVFILAGGISWGASILLGNWLVGNLDFSQWAAQFQSWGPQLVWDTLAPMGIAGLAILGLGVVSLVCSFFFRPDQ